MTVFLCLFALAAIVGSAAFTVQNLSDLPPAAAR